MRSNEAFIMLHFKTLNQFLQHGHRKLIAVSPVDYYKDSIKDNIFVVKAIEKQDFLII